MFGQIGQALVEAKQNGVDPFAAIERILPWSDFASNVTETQSLTQPEDFSFLHKMGEQYQTLRRYTPAFLEVLKLRAAPAARNVMDAIETLRGMSADDTRKLPDNAPTLFIKPRWRKLVLVGGEIDPRYYEICALSELKDALRSGDVWVQGSRQFKDFDEYLLPIERFEALKMGASSERCLYWIGFKTQNCAAVCKKA